MFPGVKFQAFIIVKMKISGAIQDLFCNIIPVNGRSECIYIPAACRRQLGGFPIVKDSFFNGILVALGLMDVYEKKHCSLIIAGFPALKITTFKPAEFIT